MCLHGDSICTVELRGPAALASYVSFVIKFIAIHQNMGPAQCGNTLLAKAHIAKLNELTESEVTELTSSTVDETGLAILKRQGSRGITIVSLQRKSIFDIQLNRYGPKSETKRSKLADIDIETSEFHQDT
jgi:hypothetical protein